MNKNAHSFPIRIYYEDTDFSGNVYHAAYLKFMERARTEFLRERNVHHHELAEKGMAFAVRRLNISYERSAKIDDQLNVMTSISQIKGARMLLNQNIERAGKNLVRADVEVVCISLAGRPLRLPQELVRALEGYWVAESCSQQS